MILIFFSGLRAANENMDKLMGRLETLSVAIGQLNPASSEKSSPATGNGYAPSGSSAQNGAKNLNLTDAQKLERWQTEKNCQSEADSTKLKRKTLVRQKKSIATDEETTETWLVLLFIFRFTLWVTLWVTLLTIDRLLANTNTWWFVPKFEERILYFKLGRWFRYSMVQIPVISPVALLGYYLLCIWDSNPEFFG